MVTVDCDSVNSVLLIQFKGCLSLNFDEGLESLSSSRTLLQTRHLYREEIELKNLFILILMIELGC